ncbi:ABC transporter permease [Gemmatimonas sp.]|jgi:ABC-2 type transport system permease protein|uniref:ABC transporter permease n=1 Tax=Gemmatimonas sp. TaxID=1962908 RepID=UPI0037BF99F0
MSSTSGHEQTRWQQVSRIARWEFNRFVKWRQQLIGMAVMLAVGTASVLLTKLVKNAKSEATTVAVVNGAALGFPLPVVDDVIWLPARYATDEAARAAVAADSVGGALLVRNAQAADIVVRKRAAWTSAVETALTAARQGAAFAALPITDAQRASLLTPFSVAVSTVARRDGGSEASSLAVTFGILGFGMLVLFNGFASLFTGITGEKQQRITEQIIAIVTPQTWMDGKILGLASAALAGTLLFGATSLVLLATLPQLLGAGTFTIPSIAGDLGTVAVVVLVTLLGIIMWFSFMAAIAATIDDPNSSPRSSLLLVPILPLGLAFTLLSRPDTIVAQVLSIFPLTSMAVLPVRLLLTSVPWWEPTLAVLLLATAAWAFRRAAGTIFALGILLHGKEPTLGETWKWVRHTR